MAGVVFPKIGYADHEGVVLSWLKSPGEPVSIGEDLLEIAVEKSVNVVVAEEAGVLLAVYAPAGAVVPEGEILGWVGNSGDQVPDHSCRLLGWEEEIAPPPDHLNEWLGGAKIPVANQAGAAGQTGQPQGRAHPAGKTGKSTRGFLKNRLRRTVAQRMGHSWEAPKVDLFTDVNFTAIAAQRKELKNRGEEAPSYNIYIAKAVADAFNEYPQMNGHWKNGGFHPIEGVHIGLAMAVPEGLITISIKHMERLSLLEAQVKMKGLIRKGLGMDLALDEQFGNSLTITNLGDSAVTGFTALLNPPEIYILAVGKLEDRAVVVNGAIEISPVSTLCLSFDHRAVDGAPTAAFLTAIKTRLESYCLRP
ncbi:MAG: 2-oxo acid dehydrogenase subunit E2 [Deltaproteobacteria bacterium]|nr:2-oxo acid dehydrogenase subunit E2 [Deltaproteobacteria bacterium]